jgi:hypothetical protein
LGAFLFYITYKVESSTLFHKKGIMTTNPPPLFTTTTPIYIKEFMRSLHTGKANLTYSQQNFLEGFRTAGAVRDEVKPINVILPTEEPVQHPVIEITPEPTQEPTQEPTIAPTPTPTPFQEEKVIIQPVTLKNYGKPTKEEGIEVPNQVSGSVKRGAEGPYQYAY